MGQQLSETLLTDARGGLTTGKEKQKRVLVSPRIALKFLERNLRNRPISRAKVERFKKVITSGGWQLNHQGIAFDLADVLIDGQNRLTAIAECGIPVFMWVAEGMAVLTRSSIDTEGGRRVAQTWAMLGDIKNATLQAAMVAVIRRVIHNFKGKATLAEVEQTREKHLNGFDWVVEHAGAVRLWMAPVSAGFAYAYPAASVVLHSVVMDYKTCEFKDPRDPMLKLHHFAMRTGSLENHEVRAELFFKTLSAIYAKSKGKKLEKLAINKDAVDFFRSHHGD